MSFLRRRIKFMRIFNSGPLTTCPIVAVVEITLFKAPAALLISLTQVQEIIFQRPGIKFMTIDNSGPPNDMSDCCRCRDYSLESARPSPYFVDPGTRNNFPTTSDKLHKNR